MMADRRIPPGTIGFALRRGWLAAPGAIAALARSLVVILSLAGTMLGASGAMAEAQGRNRVLLDSGWRFHRGDPANAPSWLRYDVLPEDAGSGEGQAAGEAPEAARPTEDAKPAVLKPWILPSANPLILDPARRHLRPAGEPGFVSFAAASFSDKDWQHVTIPHDWAIAGPFLKDGPYGGMGRLKTWGPVWYRRDLAIPASSAGKRVFLDIEGAMSYSAVWLNGHLVGGWPYGYSSYRLDLTPHMKPGRRNILAIRLDTPPDSSRWYPGGGLYRNIWLVTADPVHIAHWGTVVTTPKVSGKLATIALGARVANEGSVLSKIRVESAIYALDENGQPQGGPVARTAPVDLSIPGGSEAVAALTTSIANPRLWGPPPQQRPNLYVAVTSVRSGARLLDRVSTPFGIRTLSFDGTRGLSINGQHVRLQGVNMHHDLGALGTAFNAGAARRQLEKLRAMGVNAIRTSHNPPAPELLRLTDRMGVLVIDEIFDTWQLKKTPLDFHLIFDDWHEPDLRAMLRRDRNHPSVIIWSVGNEVGEQHAGDAGAKIARDLVSIVRQEDATRPTTTAMNWAKPDMPLPREVDLIGLNYQGTGVRTEPGQFGPFHMAFPNKMIFATESAAALSSRGEYLFPVSGGNSGPVRPGSGGDDKTMQVSAYGIYAADFGSSPDRDFAAFDRHPFVAGEFVWSGFDYLGEPTPYYGARSSYFGIFDLAGFPKDRFWLYQSRWRPDLKFVHILPHWTWPGREGKITPVMAYSSADEAELFINGKSQGRIKRAPSSYRFRWDDVRYESGEIRVVAYKHGKLWAEARESTTGPPTQLSLDAGKRPIHANGRDLVFVEITALDARGRFAPIADTDLAFAVEGPGDIVATDNGDPTDLRPFPEARRKLFHGHALVILRPRKGADGPIVVKVTGPGLKPAELAIDPQA